MLVVGRCRRNIMSIWMITLLTFESNFYYFTLEAALGNNSEYNLNILFYAKLESKFEAQVRND